MSDIHAAPPTVPTLFVEPSAANVENVPRILRRVIRERTGAETPHVSGADAAITLAIEPGIGTEGFAIQTSPRNPRGIRVVGNDATGLLHGVGKLLRLTHYSPGKIALPTWRGKSVPTSPVRGMYCAFNFNNWYVAGPREDFARYMEDLGLWGLNTIFISIIMEDPAKPEAFEARKRDNRKVLRLIKDAGLKVGLLVTPNLFSIPSPEGTRAIDVADNTPASRGNVDHRVCPSNPQGRAWMRKMLEMHLSGYEETGVDFVATFPYDAGGCGCEKCKPWGANGYVTASKETFELARGFYPGCKRILTTWCFDVLKQGEGEYAGLDKYLREKPDFADYIMADSHGDFPRYPLDVGVPGGKPMVNFAEISMWGRFPWGGYGANPLPERFQRLWDQLKHVCAGGFPYSEGIFEDINKAFCAGFYWNKDAKAADTLREYIAYEFSPDVVDTVVEAVTLLESTWPDRNSSLANTTRAWELLQQADAKLPGYARSAWRWRILYLRGLIDFELASRPGLPHSDRCDEAFEELTAIYHAENTGGPDAPRSRRCAARLAKQAELKPAGAV